MQRAGIIGEDEPFELIGGEVVPMQAKGGRYEMWRIELKRHFQRIVPGDRSMAPATTRRLDEKSFLEADFCVVEEIAAMRVPAIAICLTRLGLKPL